MTWFNQKAQSYKPINTSGSVCPLMKKPTCEVCHKCEFWEPLIVTINGKDETLWKCAFNWSTTLQSINNTRLQGMGAAFEGVRNQFVRFSGLLVQLLDAIPQVIRKEDRHVIDITPKKETKDVDISS